MLQILAIDLGTETLPALALGREPAEPGLMGRPPRPPGEGIVDRGGCSCGPGRSLGRGLRGAGDGRRSSSSCCAAGLEPRGRRRRRGASAPCVAAGDHRRRSLSIVACQIGTAFAARTERASLRSIGLASNPLLLWGIAFEVVFTAALVYLPPIAGVFGMTPPPPAALVLMAPFPVAVWGVDELRRWRLRQASA